MAPIRLNSSRKRVINLVAAAMVTMLILGSAGPDMFEPNALPPILWLAAFGNMVQWCAYLATTLRDELRADVDTIVADKVRCEVTKLLNPINSKIEEIDHEVADYGDRRQAAGTAIALTIVGQRPHNGRPLNVVE